MKLLEAKLTLRKTLPLDVQHLWRETPGTSVSIIPLPAMHDCHWSKARKNYVRLFLKDHRITIPICMDKLYTTLPN